MVQHKFNMNLTWSEGRNGAGNLTASKLNTKISIPQEMNGPGIGTNPDEMLLGAAATCYLITLSTLLENSKVPVLDLSMQAQGFVDVTNGVFTYEQIVHKPTIVVKDLTEREQRRIHRIAEKAEKHVRSVKRYKEMFASNAKFKLNKAKWKKAS